MELTKRKRKPRWPKTPPESSQRAQVSRVSDSIRLQMQEFRAGKKSGSMKKAATLDLSKLHPALRRMVGRANNHLANPLNAGRPFKVQQIIVDTSFITNATGGAGAAKNFQLDMLPQFATFAALFDQYRFTKIHSILYPRANTNNFAVMAAVTTLTMSPIIVVWDPDDSNVPAAITDVTGYPNAVMHPGYAKIEHKFKPRAAIAAFGGAFTNFADFDGWMDCASDDIEYYALKAWALGDGASQTTHQIWDMVSYVEAEFRFVH